MVVLSRLENHAFGSSISFQNLDYNEFRNGADGAHMLFIHHHYCAQIYIMGQIEKTDKLQVVIPADQCIDRRMISTRDFLRVFAQKRLCKPQKPSQTIVRLHKALIALDAMASGATQRELADVLYGQKRVSEELWRTSSLRQTVHRLCLTGEEMMKGEYSSLLLV